MRKTISKIRVNKSKVSIAAVATLTMDGCMKFLIGWIKRFGNPPSLFAFPLNETDYPNL